MLSVWWLSAAFVGGGSAAVLVTALMWDVVPQMRNRFNLL